MRANNANLFGLLGYKQSTEPGHLDFVPTHQHCDCFSGSRHRSRRLTDHPMTIHE
jgi:hypothetical protein